MHSQRETRFMGRRWPLAVVQLIFGTLLAMTFVAGYLPAGTQAEEMEQPNDCVPMPDGWGMDCSGVGSFSEDMTVVGEPQSIAEPPGPSEFDPTDGGEVGDDVGGGGIEPPVYIDDDPPPPTPVPTPTPDPLANNCVDEFGVPGPCYGAGTEACDLIIVGAITCTIAEQFQPGLKLPCAFVKASAATCGLADRWFGD